MPEPRAPQPAGPPPARPAEGLPHEWPTLISEDADDSTGPCPNCGAPMHAIRGSKHAICRNCGFKDSCCF
jgi:hypothetical protein